ncbi:MbnH family di-heme enzyme [uncultured Paraglaciecola sp.]|uniref:MbnH family di-heme enzyme n=1 Tax=uncultured Paraglaciecola sp. TaxID=1765024 RepID=UPI0030DBD3F1|tara:strand:- start:14511 stop:15674 length:1164 start_codon:yes stop_codon:yes gene_type:complete
MKFIAVCLVMGILMGCNQSSSTTVEESTQQQSLRDLLELPAHMAVPSIPDFNPLTAEKIQLGRFLFYDPKLSANQTQSCSSCHEQILAFSDAVERPFGSTGHQLVRNSQGLANVVYHSTFTWSNNGFLELEEQLNVPIRSDNPIELGVTDSNIEEVLARFDADASYVDMFAAAFPESESGASINKIIFALASFVRSMISAGSAYDQYLLGDTSALTEQQKLGFSLFNGEKFECFHCHTGSNFSVSYRDSNTTEDTIQYPFFNNGLYNVDGEGSYPAADQGLYELTLDLADRGLFRPQSLRNIELTAPYMHDGSIATLREVIEHYARGGRLIESGENAGDGNLSPLKSGLIKTFVATDDEIDAVIAFLESLTDYEFINNPKFSDPFKE